MSAEIKASEVRKEYEELDKDKLLDEVVDLVLENDKLRKKLKKYENPHTPSSKQGFDKPQAQGLPVGRKSGKNYNHQRTTRPKDKPTLTIKVTAKKNPSNGNTNIKETGYYEEVIITDFKIEKVVTLYKIKEYKDSDTGEIFMASHPDIPDKGIFGKNILAFANALHFEYRVPFEGVANIFTNVFDISMSTPTAMDICNRVANKLSYKYEELNKKLRKANVVNGDETGSNQNGISEWLWGFFTSSIAFFVFFKQRGGDIIDNVLGKNFKGILGCDGWSTYKVFSEKHGILLQRCWAHLIREVKHICKDVNGLHDAYIWIQDMFKKIKKLRKIKSKKIRQKGHDKLIAEMNMWIQIYQSHDGMRELITKVKNGKNFWFTCILYPQVEHTNNRAERGIRKFVILEKIMGCLRSEQGKKSTQIMMSLFGTWKLQGLNPYKELRAIV